MDLAGLDTAAVARALGEIADREGDLADAFLERLEEVELVQGEDGPTSRLRREEGLAVRLVREGRTHLASRDGLVPAAFVEAARQAARAQPRGVLAEPAMPAGLAPPEAAPELAEFALTVERAIRARHVAFPLRLAVRRHRRVVQVIGPRLVAPASAERFWSAAAHTPWGAVGRLLPGLGAGAAEELALALVALFRTRFAEPPAAARATVVLAPAAAAVLLHEAVAHALEVDTLARSGNPESAVGVALGAASLNVLDDPAAAPEGVARSTDDEGQPVVRRWLLRGGVVEQPLADACWARSSTMLLPGAGRRGSRHALPGPRSTYLELLPGDAKEADLLAASRGGLYLPEASRGALDPLSGTFHLEARHARRIAGGELGEATGPCRLQGRLSDLLAQVSGVGDQASPGGAGWCAKGGQKLAVWASAPALRLESVEIEPR